MAPFYDYGCDNGHRFHRYLTLANHQGTWPCECGQVAKQLISAPILVKAAPDLCYDSPIDGRPITSWDARAEDLRRSDCVPYDPEMKTDSLKRQHAHEADLDAQIDRTVEEKVEKMTGAQRRTLASEVLDQGADLVYSRNTPHE